MKILAIEKDVEGVNRADQETMLQQEALHVYKLYKNSFLREIYFSETHNAVLILECINKQEANEILENFPLVKNKMIEFELIELHPYDGYNRILKEL